MIGALPRGRTLPERSLRHRHQGLLVLLWAHVPALVGFGALEGIGGVDILEQVGVVAIIALAASLVRSNLRMASTLVAVGLVTCSATLVRMSDGVGEAHFHFFVVIALLSLYEDWVPFLIATAYVFLHHGLVGLIDPSSVYRDPHAQTHPWRWAAIHGAFAGAAAIASALAWGLNERVRTAMRRAHEQARDSDRRFKAAFEGGPHGMSIVGLEPHNAGRLLQANDAMTALVGYSEEQLLEDDFLVFTHPEHRHHDGVLFARVLNGELRTVELETRLVRADGSEVWAQVNASVVRDSSARPIYAVCQVQDISARRRHHTDNELLKAVVASSEDAIISKTLEGVVTSWNRGAELLYGYTAAEAVGKYIGDLIVPPHLSGDEMSIIRRLVAGERIHHYDTERRHKDGGIIDVSVTASPMRDEDGSVVGVSVIARDITERKQREIELLKDVEDYGWAKRVRTSLDEDRFALYVQPVVELGTGRVTRAEVLLRMRGDRGPNDMISPGEFLDVADRFDLIGEIDRWVLRNVMPLLEDGPALGVNISGRSIGDIELTRLIEELLGASSVDPEKLTIEITETATVQDVQSARVFAERLQRLGVGVALDDFGTGYGSFTYLKHMPIQFLKIDMQFTRDLIHSESDQQVVRSIVGIARDFGVETIAEGVENAETLALLARYGVDFAQGYYLGRPEPAELAPRTNAWDPSRTPA